MQANPICRVCGIELTEKNWVPSFQKIPNHLCKECQKENHRLWQKANPEKVKANQIKYNRKQGVRSFSENRECSLYLSVHIADRVLSHVFKDVVKMPNGNPGYDFICNRRKKIDVKSSTLHKHGKWVFSIKHNTTADFFLCLSFDNREDLNPLYAWLIPGVKLNSLVSTSISKGTIYKWDAYRMDISKILACCNAMK